MSVSNHQMPANGVHLTNGSSRTNGNGLPKSLSNGNTSGNSSIPIAICGIGLRLPGGIHTTQQFWDVLYNGKDMRGPIPKDRFNIDGYDTKLGKKGAIKTHFGYFLEDDLACLDVSFFNMSKQELEKVDPQQRQILEVTRECLENAGETNYRGKSIGCYVGTFGEDWLQSQSKENQYTGGYNLGGDLMIANRISYEYDFQGPSMVIKTGCSASLVGLHEACRALQNGDCTSALVAGTSLIMGPSIYAAMTSEGIISPDGSCKTFDANANGFARAEGINAVYLKTLDDAIRDGNPIRAVIRATGTNSDGKSQGLMTPNASAQEALMRKVYKDAHLDPAETAFMECHGTGTATGDPIETTAVGNLFGHTGIYIGSVKPNVGHSEGASGLTSLIKAVIALEHQIIPPNIKFSTPNPKIPFLEKNLTVPIVPIAWPKDRAERISVNSFGIGGSNCHVIIDSAKSFVPYIPKISQTTRENVVPRLLLFSANTQDSLKSFARETLEYQKQNPASTDDLAYTLAHRRESLLYRSYTVVGDELNVEDALAAPAKAMLKKQPLVMVMSGQGAQWPQMSKELIENDPKFSKDIENLDTILASLEDSPTWNIKEELLKPKETSQVYRAELSQPLCTAVQIGIIKALRRVGVVPDAVIGHSSGEISAAYAAGILSSREAIIIAYYRGVATKFQTLQGGMAAIGLGADVVSPYLTKCVVIAAENSPNSVTISGDIKAVEEVIFNIKTKNPDAFARRLQVDMAYHSPLMAEVGEHYLKLMKKTIELVETIPATHKIPMFSTVTGKYVDSSLDLAYWVLNLTSQVKFYPGFKSLLSSLPSASQVLLVEIGPHSQMAGPLRQICTASKAPYSYMPTMIRSANCTKSLLSTVGQLYQQGVEIDVDALIPNGRVLTDIPLYQWDHSVSYWYENRISCDWRFRKYGHHALLGQRIPESSELEPAWRVVLDLEDEPWLYHHKVCKDIVFPFAGYISMAGEAIRQISGIEVGYSVKHVVAHTALVLVDNKPVEIITTLRRRKLTDNSDSEYYDFTITSYSGSTWVKHCDGSVKPLRELIASPPNIKTLERRVSATRWYEIMARIGLIYGPEFQRITFLETSPTELRAIAGVGKSNGPFLFHPATMDSCFQLVIAAASQGSGRNLTKLSVPTLIEELDVFSMSERMIAESWISIDSSEIGLICSADGHVALRLHNARMTPLENDAGLTQDIHHASRLEWLPDLDFLDVSTLFDPPSVDNFTKVTMEEIVLLSLLDSAQRVQGLTPSQPHYYKFREWLCRERRRAVDGVYPLVSDAQKFTNFTREQRFEEIEKRLSIMGENPVLGLVARGIYKVCENMEALFTGTLDTLELLMQENVLTEIYNSVSFGFSRYIKLLSIKKPNLRILEVGAGTGGTTELILRDLVGVSKNPPYSQYTFTDISAGFFSQAIERFSYAPNMEYKVFDISKEPFSQGFVAGTYDLILCPNVVHATESLQITLCNLQPLLRPGGQLLLSEVCATAAKAPGYVFGNFSGWWLGEADDRKWEPYIQVDRWDRELKAAGFTGVDTSMLDAEEPYQYCAAILTRPTLAPSETKPELQAITILCEKPEEGLTHILITDLEAQGLDIAVIKFGDFPPAGRPILVALDLEGYFFQDITEDRLLAFQNLCRQHQGQKLLWLMPPTQIRCSDPRYGQSIGALRVSRQELNLPYYSLEINKSEPEFTKTILRVLKKVYYQDDTETLAPDREFAVDDGVIKIARCQPFSLAQEISSSGTSNSGVKKLDVGKPGLLETLQWVSTDANVLKDDEVEIETRAVGLNFRDIMVAMGVLSFGSGAPMLGIEMSGVVTRVGADVHHVMTGDRVVGVAIEGCFSTSVVIQSTLCIRIPDNLDFEAAATMPTVFSTALYALVEIGQMKAGHTVLIHSACGGIGHAAIQLCKNAGAEIFVTVGSETKVRYIEETFSIHRSRIFNSRNDSFVGDVMRETNGKGIDIVLNSLSGNLLHASWKCVARFGKMVELGKRDLMGFGQLDLEPFLHNRSYCCVDLAHMIQERPRDAGRLVQSVINLYRQGKLQPITARAEFDVQEIEQSFRYLQKGDHIGKAIVTFPQDTSVLETVAKGTIFKLDPDASYLITGGLGGLGRSIATWMAECGARNIIFISRSAGKGEHDQSFFRELSAMGCKGIAVPGSVHILKDVQRAIAKASSPIKGVIHLAMVLRDGPAIDLTYEEWTGAIIPKVEGAWNLHNSFLDLDYPLDFFVMSSSLVTMIDQPGQSNYAAANCFLEAFTQYRRGLGLPASVIGISPVEDVGFVAEHPSIRKKLKSMGLYFMPERETLEYFQLGMMNQLSNRLDDKPNPLSPWTSEGYTMMGLHSEVHLDDEKCQTSWRRDRRMGMYHNVSDSIIGNTEGSSGLKSFLEGFADSPESLLDQENIDYIALEIGLRIFQFMMKNTADIDISLTVTQIGMDSLMAIELRRWWKQVFGLDVSVLEIMGAGKIQQLGRLAAESLAKKLSGK